jgi:hypothetical protein
LAGRSGNLTEAVVRLVAAIVADAFAFVLWNLASRSPVRLARDVRAGLSQRATALAGISRGLGGLMLLAAGALILFPLAVGNRTYIVLETWAVLTGLLVELVIGSELRTRRP